MPARRAATADRVAAAESADPRGDASGPRTLREHERIVRSCTSCGLHRERTTAVTGDGPIDARLVVVNAAPRRYEDIHGQALAGGTRNVLDTALLAVGVDPSEVRVTSAIRCRPNDDNLPSTEEILACGVHLRAELAMIGPRVVVSLGTLPTMMLLGRQVSLERVAGYRLDILDGITLVPTYHPYEAVRGVPQAGPALRRDFGVAKAVLDGRMSTGAQAIADLRSRLSTST